MAIPIIVYGKSGAGKTRSLKEFGKDEICLIQCTKKILPFKGKFDKQMYSADVTTIRTAILKAIGQGIKVIVIDDATYIMTKIFMENHRSLKGNAAFELYNNIGDEFYTLIKSCEDLPEDVRIYIVMHEDTDDFGNIKLRTIGRLLDQKVCIEGMVTICLHCVTEDTEHYFETNSDGYSLAKSPEDMFESKRIPNDLKSVDSAICNYYEIKE